MTTDHVVTLRVVATGDTIQVWDEARITLDMLAAGSPWTFALWRSTLAGNTWKEVRQKVKLGTRIQVLIDDALQLEGVCEDARVTTSHEGGAMYVISGRDLAATAIDSDINPHMQIRGMSTGDAIATILSQFDLQVVVGADATASMEVQARRRPGPRGTSSRFHRRRKPVDLYRIRPGEKGWGVCQQLAMKAGCFLYTGPTDDGVGAILDSPRTSGAAQYAFTRAQLDTDRFACDFLDSDYAYTIRGVPTQITYFSNGSLINDAGRTMANAFNATITEDSRVIEKGSIDLWCQRFVTNRDARTREQLHKYIDHLVATENRRHQSYTIRTQGFGQNGTLYAVNAIAKLRDDLEEPKLDEFMTIMRVAFSHGRRGQTTEITMCPVGLVEMFPDDRNTP